MAERNVRPKGPLGKKIVLALEETELSANEIARRLAGPGQSERDITNARSALYRWIKGGGITERNAERLAAAFMKPSDYFKGLRPLPTEGEITAVEERLEDVRLQVLDLRRRFDEVAVEP